MTTKSGGGGPTEPAAVSAARSKAAETPASPGSSLSGSDPSPAGGCPSSRDRWVRTRFRMARRIRFQSLRIKKKRKKCWGKKNQRRKLANRPVFFLLLLAVRGRRSRRGRRHVRLPLPGHDFVVADVHRQHLLSPLFLLLQEPCKPPGEGGLPGARRPGQHQDAGPPEVAIAFWVHILPFLLFGTCTTSRHVN